MSVASGGIGGVQGRAVAGFCRVFAVIYGCLRGGRGGCGGSVAGVGRADLPSGAKVRNVVEVATDKGQQTPTNCR